MPSSTTKANYFSIDGVYPCPVCRLGQIKALPLMDAMVCDLCRHIFTASLEKQRLLLPPTLIGLSAYFLLSTPDTSESWLPEVWTGLTFLFHLGIIGYAVVGYYQFSIGTTLRVMRQHMFKR